VWGFKENDELALAARSPPDLRRVLTEERVSRFCSQAAGMQILFATERIDQSILDALFRLADQKKVIDQGRRMQEGEVVNFIQGHASERRSALHTATRGFFDGKIEGKRAREASHFSEKEIAKLRTLLPQLQKFTTIVQVGMGGSSLGPEAVYRALEFFSPSLRKVYFLSNVDPDEISKILKEVELFQTLFIIVSKSGTTLETVTNETILRDHLQRKGGQPKDQFISVTEEKTSMDDPSRYLASFYIGDYIGGRYSVTSMVGGVLLAITLGIDQYLDFLRGAHAMDQVALREKGTANLPLLGALLSLWNHNFLGYPTVAIIPYSRGLSRFPAHLQQLFMESNGKHIDREGRCLSIETSPVVWGEPGTSSQHSFFQLLHQGTSIVPLECIGFKKTQYGEDWLVGDSYSQEKLLANLIAQMIALAQGKEDSNPNREFLGNRPSHLLFAEQLTPFTLGALLSYYEHKSAFLGFLWDINSFDQEGVQLGKTLAAQMMTTFTEARQGKSSSYILGKAYVEQLMKSTISSF